MSNMVGIRFKPCGKIYDFQNDALELKSGDTVVVESEMGLSLGKVVVARGSSPPEPDREYKKVLRLASEEDFREEQSNESLRKEAFDFCRQRIAARGLPMKLIRTECTLDRKRIIFYFVSDKRIDFRELVKDLAQKFRTRIEMRQVGVRDESKMIGGLGLCGRPLCCTAFLTEFAPISIKMAKKQELVLNTGKLSGVCGRLMCCLSYEYKNAQEMLRDKEALKLAKAKEKEEEKKKEEETAYPEIEMPAPGEISPGGKPAPSPTHSPQTPRRGGKYPPAAPRSGRPDEQKAPAPPAPPSETASEGEKRKRKRKRKRKNKQWKGQGTQDSQQ